jgi:D-alanyl-D-alanine carboxypeptidase
LIVEKVTGHSIGQELRNRIFRPLHVSETTYPTTPAIPGPHAHGYFVLEHPPARDVTGISPSLSPSAGAIVSTANDVADFYRGLLAGRVLKPQLLQAMKATHAEKKYDIQGQRYGLGLMSFPTACGTAWGHIGSFPGYHTVAFTSADGSRQAVLMVNLDPTAESPTALKRFYKLAGTAYCSTM